MKRYFFYVIIILFSCTNVQVGELNNRFRVKPDYAAKIDLLESSSSPVCDIPNRNLHRLKIKLRNSGFCTVQCLMPFINANKLNCKPESSSVNFEIKVREKKEIPILCSEESKEVKNCKKINIDFSYSMKCICLDSEISRLEWEAEQEGIQLQVNYNAKVMDVATKKKEEK